MFTRLVGRIPLRLLLTLVITLLVLTATILSGLVAYQSEQRTPINLTWVLASGGLAAGIGWLVAAWFVRPLANLNRALQDLAQGRWDWPLDLNRHDEIGQLTHAFNIMRRRLGRSVEDLAGQVVERQRVEVQLRREQDLINRVMDTSPVGILEYDRDMKLHFASSRAQQILDLEPDAGSGYRYPPWEVFDLGGKQLEREQYPFVRVYTTLEPISGERVMLQSPGRQRVYISVNAAPLFGDRGVLDGVVVTVEDITERYNAEVALLDSESRFRALVRNLSVGVMLHGGRGEVLLANLAAIEMLGASEDQLQNLCGADGVSTFFDEKGDSLPDAALPLRIAQTTGQPVRNRVLGILRSPRREMAWLQIDALPHLAADGSVRQVLCVISDITTRRRAEDWLRAVVAGTAGEFGQAFFNSLVKHLAAALETRYAFVGEMDRQGHIQVLAFWSGTDFGEPFAYDLEGTPCSNVLAKGICLYMQGVQDLFPSDKGLVRMGVESYMGVPLVDSTHRRLGVLVVMDNRPMADVEERRSILTIFAARAGGELERLRTEEQILSLNAELEMRVAHRTQQLETANNELEAFAYSVSHDLRAPLRSIEGFGRILSEDFSQHLGDEGQMYLDRIGQATRRMAEMIESLLRLSRYSRADLRVENVDLTAMANGILVEFAEQQPERRVVWKVAADLEAGADPKLIEIALRNLLANAWKFTAREEFAQISVGVESAAGEQVFFVRDNGVGFDMAFAGALFGPFQRLHSANDFEGTGIGLATVQRIVSRHGGRIWAKSALDQGAVFYFTLPGVG